MSYAPAGWRPGGVLVASMLAVACGPDAGLAGKAGVLERDSAGVHIVENPAVAVERTLAVSPAPVLSVGTVEGLPEEQLFQVSAAARLSDGTVVVANAGSRELRFYGPDGAHLVTAGGAGRGPGEFSYPVGILVLPGDTIQVQDILDRVRFTATGVFVERLTTDRGRLQEIVGPGAQAEGGVWLPGDRLFTPAYHQESQGPPMAGPPFRPGMTLLRVDEAAGRVDTLGSFGGIRQQYVEVEAGGRVSPMTQPFAVSTSWAQGAADGSLLVADSERPEVHLFRGDGTHVLVRWDAEPEPLTAGEVEAWKDRVRADPRMRERMAWFERGWAAMDMPDRKAAYGRDVALGRDGSFWVPVSADLEPDPATFLVFTPDGRLRGRATLPGPFRVMDVGADWVLGVWFDEYGVEYLRMYTVGG